MKIRIGTILGIDGDSDPGAFNEAVTATEELGFDSLWLAELTSRPAPDPMVGLTWAAARTTRLKLGPGVLVLPGRNPAVVAKQLATLDRLSGGRLLVAFGLGLPDPRERAAFPVPDGRTRGEAFDAALVLVRRYLSGETVDGVRVRPDPLQRPLDLWIGGSSAAALVRAGRLADGWLPSLITPEEAAEGRAVIEREAEPGALRGHPHVPGRRDPAAAAGRHRPPAAGARPVRSRPEGARRLRPAPRGVRPGGHLEVRRAGRRADRIVASGLPGGDGRHAPSPPDLTGLPLQT
jgi:probable F420-dependent oxidoreductase